MSVLIKEMQMPTSCLKGGCPVDGFFCQLWEDKYWSRWESPEKMRHRDCPLIALPDHGDLIDRDALMEHGCYVPLPLGNLPVIYRSYVKNAPVVIPAERNVKVCPLHSDDEVTEYCVEGPCTDEMEGRCPIAERSEE